MDDVCAPAYVVPNPEKMDKLIETTSRYFYYVFSTL